MKNKKLFLYLFLSLVFLSIVVLLYFFIFKNKELTVYDKLFEHCTKEASVRKCNVFLKSYTEDQGNTCMEIVLPVVDPSKRDIEICVDEEVIWENPYEDYSLNIPIVLKMYYNKRFFKRNDLDRIEIDIMEDEVVYKLLENIYFSDENVILVRTKAANEDIVKGYKYYVDLNEEEKEMLCLGLIDVGIKSIEKINDQLEFNIFFRMNDKEYEYTFTAEEIQFIDWEKRQAYTLMSTSELSDHFNFEDKYNISFLLFDLEEDQLISEFYGGLDNIIEEYFSEGGSKKVELRLKNISK